jgi:hypothetical protein
MSGRHGNRRIRPIWKPQTQEEALPQIQSSDASEFVGKVDESGPGMDRKRILSVSISPGFLVS